MNTQHGKLGLTQRKQAQFERLFEEFINSYLDTEDGQWHVEKYVEGREQGRRNYQEIVEAADRGEDVTERVLLQLLSHSDTEPNREKGAWINVAPTINDDVRKWFEGSGWVRPEDWPHVAQAILSFVRRCNEQPDDLQAACDEFSASPYSKGFQAAMLSPILNALHPQAFLIINDKPRKAIGYFTGDSYGPKLTEYPAANAAGWQLISAVADIMHQFEIPEMRDDDLFDMFCHWLRSVKDFTYEDDEEAAARYWKIAPGLDAWNWEACRAGNYIAMGWDALGDISGLSRSEFDTLRDELVPKHEGWNKVGVTQVWRFAQIQEGDRIVANHGTSKVLAVGTVVGPYYFEPDQRHGHRLPVRWDDLTQRRVDKGGWRRTLIELNKPDFEAICTALPIGSPVAADSPFSETTFEILARLHDEPTHQFYTENKDRLRAEVVEPFKRLMVAVRDHLPPTILEMMETEKRVFANILKQFATQGCWDFYWGAFYPKGGKRTEDAQLFLWMDRFRLEFGFYIGEYGSEQRDRFLRNCQENYDVLARALEPSLPERHSLLVGAREGFVGGPGDSDVDNDRPPFKEWLRAPAESGIRVAVSLLKEQIHQISVDDLAHDIAEVFQGLFPLVLLATLEDPMPAIGEYLEIDEPPEINPQYSLSQFADDTGLDQAELAGWVRAIERKGQAIVYGPPGTGKTFAAEHLARHLVGGGDGFHEVVQFHPAYAYEDFMQGIRPKPRRDGQLHYPVVPGRFLDFCDRARKREGRCVLIIDEINRANLARVFGELMYLLEYREREIALAAGGSLRIPRNVHIIGTMNTADRSIALVDHALRRRFAFLALYPNFGVLRRYHQQTGFPVEGLVEALQRLNRHIGDPHYEVGISFFLREDLEAQIGDIWKMEIEPYLVEYFFDQPEKAEQFRWTEIREQVLP